MEFSVRPGSVNINSIYLLPPVQNKWLVCTVTKLLFLIPGGLLYYYGFNEKKKHEKKTPEALLHSYFIAKGTLKDQQIKISHFAGES